MADRCTLAIHKLDEFKAWLDAQGIEHRPTNADYQVLQVQLPGVKGWHAIYQRLDAKVHLSVTGPLVPLVRRFVRGQPAQLLISMNRCCEKAVPLGKATCPDCEEASAGYQAAMTSRETPPWE